MSLLVIVPTRRRPALCERLMDSFAQTADSAQLLFVTDGDDDSYAGTDWRGHQHAEMSPRGFLADKLNHAAARVRDDYDQLFFVGDDCVFVTPHWDTLMLRELDKMGGSGILYANDGRRADVPEHWLVSCDIIRELGWFANPALSHYYLDNSWADLGKRASLLRYCPDVVIEHRHYQSDKKAARDALYSETEERFGTADLKAFTQWRAGTQIAVEVSALRRRFNPDVQWVLERA